MSRPARRHLHQTWVRVAAGHCGRAILDDVVQDQNTRVIEATVTTGGAEMAAELLAEAAALLGRVEAYLRTAP